MAKSILIPPSDMSLRKKRAEEYFKTASQRLLKKIPDTTCAQLKGVVLPNFDSLQGVEATVTDLEKSIETFLLSREDFIANSGRLQHIKDTTIKWCRVLYPFLSLILGIAKEAAAVHEQASPTDKLDSSRRPDWSSMRRPLSISDGILS